MTKTELIAQIASAAQCTKAESERILSAILDVIQETLIKEGQITLTGFGTFVVEQRKARKGHNPRTGEAITIAEAKVIKFSASKNLKDSIQ